MKVINSPNKIVTGTTAQQQNAQPQSNSTGNAASDRVEISHGLQESSAAVATTEFNEELVQEIESQVKVLRTVVEKFIRRQMTDPERHAPQSK